MLYNNQFIPQYYPQDYGQQNQGFIWVQGENSAKAYPVVAGKSAILMDSENSVFYIKSTDASGMPLPLRIFDYTERIQNGSPKPAVEESVYVTKDEFEKLKEELRMEIKRTRRP